MIQVLFFCAFITQKTVKNYIHAYFNYDHKTAEYMADHFSLIVAHENKRGWNPILRERKKKTGDRIVILLYKDFLTVIGPGNPWTIHGDDVWGGGATVGGFQYFDSLFHGVGFPAETLFLMAGSDTRIYDEENRAQVNESGTVAYRWAMDFGMQKWADYFAGNTKIQCLRNAENGEYDQTYFDGVFIDDIIHSNSDYGLYPFKYWNPRDPVKSDLLLRKAMFKSIIKVVDEYHRSSGFSQYKKSILAVGNINKSWMVGGLWKEYLAHLDGGMEETYFADTTLAYADFVKIIDDIASTKGKKKICLVHKQVAAQCGKDPMSAALFDTTQMMYGLSAYLMCCNPGTYFSFGSDYEHIFWAPILNLDLGQPVGKYKILSDSLLSRPFQRGLVLCNPTYRAKVITLSPKRYSILNANNNKIAFTTLLVKPHNGLILLKN